MLPDEDWEMVDQALDRFEQSWRAGEEPPIADFLPPGGHHCRCPVLVALVKVDQEYRWRRRDRRLLEAYLEAWPDLSDDLAVLTDLFEAECLTRFALHDPPDREELRRRFPTICDRIDLTLLADEPPVLSPGDLPTAPSPVDTSGEAAIQPPQDESPLRPGQCIDGRYEIVSLLGRGAMGWVYRARHARLGHIVAMKVPRLDPASGPDVHRRFLREGRAAASLYHPHICRIYDAGEDQGVLYLTMELIEGQTLAERLDPERHPKEQGPMTVREVVELVAKLAWALAVVHKAGVVHRDIKPSNVMIDPDGQPRLMDFGLARKSEADDAGAGGSGTLAGTLPYMAPEQIQLSPADQLTDVYSLGVLLYHALVGAIPFGGKDAAAIARNVLHLQPTPPSRRRDGIDAELEAICLKAIAKSRESRYQSAEELATALDSWLERSLASETVQVGRPNKALPRRWLMRVGVLTACFTGALFIYLRTGEGLLEIRTDQDNVRLTIGGTEERELPVTDGIATAVVPVGRDVKIQLKGVQAHTAYACLHWRNEKVRVSLNAVDGWIINSPVRDVQFSADSKNLCAAIGDSPEALGVQEFDAQPSSELDRDGVTWRAANARADRRIANRDGELEIPSGALARTTPLSPESPNTEGTAVSFYSERAKVHNVALSNDGKFLYATMERSESLFRIGFESNARGKEVFHTATDPTNAWAGTLALTADRKKLVVNVRREPRPNDPGGDQLSILDVASGKFLPSTIPLDGAPTAIALHPDSDFAYVATRKPGPSGPTLHEVALRQPCRITRTLPFPSGFAFELVSIAVCPARDRIFVGDQKAKRVFAVGIKEFKTLGCHDVEGCAPSLLAVDLDETVLAVAVDKDRKLFLLDPGSGSILARLAGFAEGVSVMRFSPEGRWLFAAHAGRRGGIGVIDLDGIRPRVKMVFASDRLRKGAEGSGIYRTELGAGKVEQLVANDGDNLFPRWSPDGHTIAFISARPGTAKVCVIDDGGTNLRRLDRTDPILGGECPLAWSPSGGQIAFIGGERQAVRIVDVATGQVNTIVSGAVEDELISHEAVAWRKSDNAILLLSTQSGLLLSTQSGQGNARRLFCIDPATHKAVAMTRVVPEARRCAGPTPSPDGRLIAFVQNPLELGGSRRICTMNADGDDFRVLSGPPGMTGAWLSWSSSGKRLAYATHRDGKQQIFLLDVATGLSTWFSDKASNDICPDLFIDIH